MPSVYVWEPLCRFLGLSAVGQFVERTFEGHADRNSANLCSFQQSHVKVYKELSATPSEVVLALTEMPGLTPSSGSPASMGQ